MNAIAVEYNNFLPDYVTTVTKFNSQSKLVEQNTENLKVSEEKLTNDIHNFINFLNSHIHLFIHYDVKSAQQLYSINATFIKGIQKTIDHSTNKALVEASKPLLEKLIEINKILAVIGEDIEIDESSPEYLAIVDELMEDSIKSGLNPTL